MEKVINLVILKSKNKTFHKHNEHISIKNIDINILAVSNEVFFGKKGFKFFIGFKNAKKIRLLCILLPKMSAYRKGFDETKYMPFLIKDNESLKKYNEIFSSKKNLIVSQYIMKYIMKS